MPPSRPPDSRIWPEGNVTFGYLSTLNRWGKRFNFLLSRGIVSFEGAGNLALAASIHSRIELFQMSEKIKILYYALWLAHPVLQTVIAIAMLRRGQHREFKYFFAYVVAQIVTFAVVFPTYLYYYPALFYVSWFSTAISVALGFKVIHEAFLDVFRPFHTLRDLGTVLFKWPGLVTLLGAGVVSVSTNSLDTPPWVQAILTAQRCVRIIQVGMVLFLLFFARYLGVSRRQHRLRNRLGLWNLCLRGIELGRVLDGRSPE